MVTKGIKLIHEEEITSAVSSVTVDNVFTDNYQFYKVYFSGLKGSDSTGDTVKFQFLVSNSADTNSEYDRDNIYGTTNGAGGMGGSYNQNHFYISNLNNGTGASSSASLIIANRNTDQTIAKQFGLIQTHIIFMECMALYNTRDVAQLDSKSLWTVTGKILVGLIKHIINLYRRNNDTRKQLHWQKIEEQKPMMKSVNGEVMDSVKLTMTTVIDLANAKMLKQMRNGLKIVQKLSINVEFLEAYEKNPC